VSNPFIKKLSRFVVLGDEEVGALEHLSRNPRDFKGGHDLILEGAKPEYVFLLMEGWAYRYKHLKDGSRQILAYLLPGDLCDIHVFLLDEMDNSIGLLCDSKVVMIPAGEVLSVMDQFPKIERALWWATLVDEGTLREWLLNVGQRNAYQKLSHLFCELAVRMKAAGLVDDDGSFSLPVTQIELADTTGLTSVHVNRTLKRLRDEKMITIGSRRLHILDPERLAEVAGFSQEYLHVEGEPVEMKLRTRLGKVG